ncbi:MAG TPA: acyl-CoA dehydrogenase family protein, partial [Acidimicrobiales bacterium]|nr:acyl-CoA dehydrogenase family protein [Acidimicrobiales bacterium]
MDFDLSADQQALREAAAALLEGKAGHDALRARVGAGAVVGTLPGAGEASTAATDAPRGYDLAAWDAMSEQGWLAIELPEDEGGLGLGLVEVAVLCEELGRRLVAAPFLPSVVALGALSDTGARATAATKEWREALSQGSAVGCTVFVPPGRLSITEGPTEGEVRVQGATPPSPYAPSADVAVLVCEDGTYAVDLRSVARAEPLAAMDRTRELGVLQFDGTPAVRLGGAHAAARALDRAASLVSAEMLGAADHVLSMSVGYAKDRVQFGKPIGSFQAVKHMLAD